jgi:Trk K+ transport system NAD-binding subunit
VTAGPLQTVPRAVTVESPAGPAGHVVLFGVGTVGAEVMRRLREIGVDVIAVDRAPSDHARQQADACGARVVPGEITTPEVFAQLGLRAARSFIACTSDDKTNLEVALIVHDARPDLRTVVRLNNDNLGRQLEARFPSWTVLGLPSLAAPAFVAASLSPDARRSWRIADDVVAVVEVPIEKPSMVRDYPEWTPLYVRREDGAVEHWPPPPTPLQAGDWLGVVVEAAQLREIGRPGVDGLADATERPNRSRLWLRALGARILDADRRLLTALTAFLAMAVLSTFVFVEYKRLDLVSSLYYVLTTMSTTGYGDINLLDDSAALKLFGAALMMLSLLVTSVLTAFLTNWVLADRLSRLFGRHRTTAFDHVIVVGLGNVGFRVLQELRRIAPETTGIDQGGRESLAAEALQDGATVITGDARQGEAFRRANVDDARSIVVATSDDLVNLEIALSARETNPRVRIVLRVFDGELALRVRGTFDVDHVLSPAAIAAPVFAAAALGRAIADRFTVEGSDYLFVRMHVETGSAWVGATIGDVLRGRDAVAVAYQPAIGAARIRPTPRIPLRSGDVVSLICAPTAWQEIEDEAPLSSSVRSV